jgi:hypothetical protein
MTLSPHLVDTASPAGADHPGRDPDGVETVDERRALVDLFRDLRTSAAGLSAREAPAAAHLRHRGTEPDAVGDHRPVPGDRLGRRRTRPLGPPPGRAAPISPPALAAAGRPTDNRD